MTSIDTIPSDRERIIETCNSMAWYADRRLWQDLETLFTTTVVVDYTSLWGGEPQTTGRVDLVLSWSETLGRLAATQHMIVGHLVTIAESGEAATCVANFQAAHVGDVEKKSAIWILGGHYRFDFALVDGTWKIAGLTMTKVWETGPREVMTGAA